MKTAILIHGWPDKEEFFDPNTPSPSNNQWFPWIQKQLSMKGWNVQTPEMPDAYEPDYEKWKMVFEQFSVDENTTLVGHSYGGGFLVRWLSENKIKVGRVVLVAPWIGMDPEDSWAKLTGNFFIFEIDRELVSKTNGLTIFVSSDDDKDILSTVEFLKGNINGYSLTEFTDKGHFTYGDMGTREFPELLEEIFK